MILIVSTTLWFTYPWKIICGKSLCIIILIICKWAVFHSNVKWPQGRSNTYSTWPIRYPNSWSDTKYNQISIRWIQYNRNMSPKLVMFQYFWKVQFGTNIPFGINSPFGTFWDYIIVHLGLAPWYWFQWLQSVSDRSRSPGGRCQPAHRSGHRRG